MPLFTHVARYVPCHMIRNVFNTLSVDLTLDFHSTELDEAEREMNVVQAFRSPGLKYLATALEESTVTDVFGTWRHHDPDSQEVLK